MLTIIRPAGLDWSKMRKRKTQPAELAAPETRIVFAEAGSSGLQENMGFVTAAYETKLQWPSVQPIYAKLRRSMPEMVMVGNTFQTWGRHVRVVVELPDNPTDDDKAYAEFVEQDQNQNIDGGFTSFGDALFGWTPFYGWGWWEAPASVRDPNWIPPDGDTWRSEASDGLIGIRRLAYRDPSTFDHWEFDQNKRVKGLWQSDWTINNPKKSRTVLLPVDQSLHVTYGDPNNPEGLSPLEAVYRVYQIKFGLEVVNGIGFEHAAGYLNITTTQQNLTLSAEDKNNIRAAAKAILTAQQGNYATWPYGIEGEVKDVSFGAAPSLLEAIKYYGILALSCYAMGFMAMSLTSGAGSFAAMNDSSSMAVFTFNAMLDGFAQQYDAQIGKRLYEWNKARFPNLTKRPRLKFSHIEKDTAIAEVSQFVSAMANVMPMGDEDWKAIREKIGFLPKTLPEQTAPTAESKAQSIYDEIVAARQQVQNGRP